MAVSGGLHGAVALVTGGASGIGEGIVRQFASRSAYVAIGDVDETAGTALADELGECVAYVHLDVTSEDSFSSCLKDVVARWGKLDVLVNNAGIVFPAAEIQDTGESEFDKLMAVNIKGTYLGCRLAHPYLKRTRGNVLNISSLVGIVGEKSHAVYGATKGAINALTRCVAADWREDGIRVNALCPSDVWTNALEQWCMAQDDRSFLNRYADLREQGICAEPAEIGAIAAFLCSAESRFINGAVIPASFAAECGYEI